MLLKLSAHISSCLERATNAEHRALEAADSAIRNENELLAQSWRHLAKSYQFVESLEKFLAQTAHGKHDGKIHDKNDGLSSEPGTVLFEPPTTPEDRPIIRRRRFKQEVSFKDRLMKSAYDAREQASRLPAGPERESLLQKARQSDTAASIDSWISSPGSRPPGNFDLGKKPKA